MSTISFLFDIAMGKITERDVKNHIGFGEKPPCLGPWEVASLCCNYGSFMCNYNWISLGVICWHNHSGFL